MTTIILLLMLVLATIFCGKSLSSYKNKQIKKIITEYEAEKNEKHPEDEP